MELAVRGEPHLDDLYVIKQPPVMGERQSDPLCRAAAHVPVVFPCPGHPRVAPQQPPLIVGRRLGQNADTAERLAFAVPLGELV
jgi:hypothetical protein